MIQRNPGFKFPSADAVLVKIIGIDPGDVERGVGISFPAATAIQRFIDAADMVFPADPQPHGIVLAIADIREIDFAEQRHIECARCTQTIDSQRIVLPVIFRPFFMVNDSRRKRFHVGQSVVSRAAGVISSDTAINIDTMITTMETAMESMEIGELVILALETMLVSLCMKVISVFITVILYGRMIEIYLYSSVGAIPFATMSNREWGQIGNNYLRGLFALAFQGFFMMVCVGIYAVLVANMAINRRTD